MHEVLGARPSMDPPVLVASFHPDADPIPLLMDIVEPSSPDTASDTANTSVASVATPHTSPKKKRRKSNPIVEFLIEESAKEQKRHEESEAKMDRFLGLFEKLIDKI
ncbi:hypothetical protein DPEC_G00156590 [Dallia pectoralis]|uniref:Uncharacterized protein n=1 Tax=Dallia pectoralis TaxID=75939 RepID=A0ACC2GKR1_DALPE|nr:hypothetical protein DPEC_G00156590 [Dallia pectoralis]